MNDTQDAFFFGEVHDTECAFFDTQDTVMKSTKAKLHFGDNFLGNVYHRLLAEFVTREPDQPSLSKKTFELPPRMHTPYTVTIMCLKR